MLRWVAKPVDSPYGTVLTLHWAVPEDEGDSVSAAQGRALVREDDDDAVDAETALQVELEASEDQLGAVLWNSNAVALNYLHQHVLFPDGPSQRSAPLKGITVVELGAGVGCLGIALAMGGATTVVTDMKELVPLMRHNIQLNASAVCQHSGGAGQCVAQEWKWGPSVSVNPKKYKAAGTGPNPLCDAEESVASRMLSALRKPSEPFRAVQAALRRSGAAGKATVDYVVLCDALYGNPKDWPQLLYTLSEMLAANPEGCVVVNFCEQRVHDVEGEFLRLLQDENKKADRWTERVRSGADGQSAPLRVGAPPPPPHDLRDWALEETLRALQGHAHRWHFETKVVAEAHSELDMAIHATVIRWVRRRQVSPASTPAVSESTVGKRRPRPSKPDTAPEAEQDTPLAGQRAAKRHKA